MDLFFFDFYLLTFFKKSIMTYNEGQYGLKPGMANFIMGFLEFIFLMGWFLGSFAAILGSVFSLDFEGFIDLTSGLGFVLAGLFILWNCLVWFVKPLRTKFNYRESLWNIVFIVWTIVDTVRMM